jgi:hypothetical protein
MNLLSAFTELTILLLNLPDLLNLPEVFQFSQFLLFHRL